MASVLDLMGYVQQQGERGRQRGQTQRLGDLAGQSYTAPAEQRPSLLGEMAKISPQFAQQQQGQMQEQGDRRAQKLAGAAKYMLSAVQSNNEAAKQGAWRTVKPFLEELVGPQGKIVPDQWTDEMLPALHQAIAAAGGPGAGANVQSTYINAQGQRVAIMRDGSQQVLGDANQSIRVLEQPGALPYGVVTSGGVAGQVVPLGSGQPQRAPGEVPFAIDPNLPPQVQAAIRANPEAGSAQGITSLPQVGGQPVGPVRTPTAGEIEAEKQRAQLAALPQREAIETQAALERARAEAEIQTQAQAERATQATQIEREATLPKLRQQIADLKQLRNDLGTKYSTGPINAVIPDMLQSADNQVFLTRVNEAVLDAASMLTGVISDKDMEFLRKATISMTNKEDANRDILDRKIRILETAEAQAQGGAQGRLNAGAVEDGYRFKGGDPADPNSWERI